MSDDDWDPERLRRRFARSIVDPALTQAFKEAPPARTGTPGAPVTSPSPKKPGRLPRSGPETSPRVGVRTMGVPSRPTSQAARSVRVVVELNPDHLGGVDAARSAFLASLGQLGLGDRMPGRRGGRRYVFVELLQPEVEWLAREYGSDKSSPVRRFWRDQPLYPLLDRSVRTVKADACMATFGADGTGIVVAVADSGIDGTHPHFVEFRNLDDLPAGVEHRDFTGKVENPLVDGYGHGTHVAGIVAGRTSAAETTVKRIVEVRDGVTEATSTEVQSVAPDTVLRGVAPRAKIVSLKVLDDAGRGYSSALIEALEHVHEVNDAGRAMRIHCVNLSLGYPFEAEWYAAGHSPLCEVVDRLSRSGVVMVAAAGNDGSMLMQTEGRRDRQRIGLDQSINDPGNAGEAITVGATHAEAPHKYGVSYFSSRGPTADGRVKPDLVAPGERILSCAAAGSAGLRKQLEDAGEKVEPGVAYLREESGTSMAAPHVAGAVASLLSVRSEFIGRPEAVKAILVGSCTDLKRKSDFQGAGLLDVLRALQSV